MPASGNPPVRDEGDLHRLVDGLLDNGRLGEVLLHLKANAAEAARVAAWREQNELLRAAFAGVEEDPIPASLRLTPLRLRCVDDARATASAPLAVAPAALPRRAAQDDLPIAVRGRSRPGYGVATICFALVASALAAAWLALNHPAHGVQSTPFAAARDGGLVVTPVIDGVDDLREGAAREATALPTTTIPDLGSLGFEFAGATMRTAPARAVVFSYQRGPAVRLTVSVSRQEPGAARPGSAGTIGWQRDGRAFALAGTLDADRLAAVAAYLQATMDVSP